MTKRRETKQRRKRQAWTVDDARWFLESTWHAGEALYEAYAKPRFLWSSVPYLKL
jgi:hypothetical protein